jgi:hypothetical protein
LLRTFVNLFLSLIFPIGVLFTVVATLYYLKEFELGKAIKLGVIAGMLSGIAFSLLISILINMKRAFQIHRYQRLHTKEHAASSSLASRQQTGHPSHVAHSNDTYFPKKGEKRFMLLMDYDVAYEVALYAVESQKIGLIQKADKQQGEIVLQQRGRLITVKLSKLSPHSSQIIVQGMEDMERFIDTIKEKEFSFLDYD